jgi:hypothetical protein
MELYFGKKRRIYGALLPEREADIRAFTSGKRGGYKEDD